MENPSTMNGDFEENNNEVMEEKVTVVIDPEKAARFQEESKDRMSKICQQIFFLEKIASKRTVDYTKENVEKMFSYLEKQLEDCKQTFMARFEESEDKGFDFNF